MKLTIFYGEGVGSYIAHCPIDKPDHDCEKADGECIVEWAPQHHQINLSNEFSPGWRDVDGWYMGCIWIKGVQGLTREQFQNILKKVPITLGEHIYGTTVQNSIFSLSRKMDRLITYIVTHSPIMLNNVTWDFNNITEMRRRMGIMLSAEAKLMSASSYTEP